MFYALFLYSVCVLLSVCRFYWYPNESLACLWGWKRDSIYIIFVVGMSLMIYIYVYVCVNVYIQYGYYSQLRFITLPPHLLGLSPSQMVLSVPFTNGPHFLVFIGKYLSSPIHLLVEWINKIEENSNRNSNSNRNRRARGRMWAAYNCIVALCFVEFRKRAYDAFFLLVLLNI